MGLCCGYTKFQCRSFSYSEKLFVCNLIPDFITAAKSSKDLDESNIYDFYLRIPFFDKDEDELDYNDGKCYQRR